MQHHDHYRVEHRIATLATSAVLSNGKIDECFQVETIGFSPWDLSPGGRYRGDFWLAESEVDADSLADASDRSWRALARIVPRLAVVTQSYAGPSFP